MYYGVACYISFHCVLGKYGSILRLFTIPRCLPCIIMWQGRSLPSLQALDTSPIPYKFLYLCLGDLCSSLQFIINRSDVRQSRCFTVPISTILESSSLRAAVKKFAFKSEALKSFHDVVTFIVLGRHVRTYFKIRRILLIL